MMEAGSQESTKQSTLLDLIKNEIENFRVGRNRNRNSSCEDFSKSSSCSCAGAILAEKLVQILENEKKERTPKTISPEEKAMSNSIVVRNIMSQLDVHSLLEFRQVSRLWREEATSLLLFPPHPDQREEFLCVSFKGFTAKDCCSFRHRSRKTLEDFLEESDQNQQMSIYSGFIFEGGVFQNDPPSSLTRFFSDVGPRIQHLNLNLEHLNAEDFEKTILKWIPNLISLIINPQKIRGITLPQLAQEEEKVEGQRPRTFLKKLRHITLPNLRAGLVDLIQEILTSTPNLTSIEDPYLKYVDEIVSAGKISLVKSFTWSFLYNTELLPNLLRFVAAGPKLTSMTFGNSIRPINFEPPPDTGLFPALFSLFNLSQNTLEKVTGVEILGRRGDLTVGLQFPPLINLTELKVGTDDAGPSCCILTRGHDLSTIAPNLKSLVLEGRTNFYPFPSSSNAHDGLQKLEILIWCPTFRTARMRQWVETLGGHYPNIIHLDLYIQSEAEENIPECLKLIPRYFKQLEQLFLRFWMAKSTYDQIKSEWNLDEALTGFSKEACNALKKQEKPDPEFQKIEVLEHIRTSPSILDLKKLTNLTFEVQLKGKSEPLWTKVSQFYAFQPMAKRQGLQVHDL